MATTVELTLLHGFTQDGSAWESVLASLPQGMTTTAVDLPGHGGNSRMRPADSRAFLAAVGAETPSISPGSTRILCGYSMGGRIAFQLAGAAADDWDHVVAISCGPGISQPERRSARLAADSRLAECLVAEGIEAFADRWESNPIWQGDPAEVRAKRREMILRQDPNGLAAALRAAGQGALPPFTGWRGAKRPAVTIIRGSRDRLYVEPARALGEIAGAELTVLEGGHSLPLESPGAVAAAIASAAGL